MIWEKEGSQEGATGTGDGDNDEVGFWPECFATNGQIAEFVICTMILDYAPFWKEDIQDVPDLHGQTKKVNSTRQNKKLFYLTL